MVSKATRMKTIGLAAVFVLLMTAEAVFSADNIEFDLKDNDDTSEAFYKRSACKDKIRESSCKWYKGRGYCARNSRYYSTMSNYCPLTCGICKPVKPVVPGGNGVEKVSVNINECLRAHNSKRTLHGASPLTWDPVLARKAQAYAMKMAETDKFVHDPNRGYVGENLQWFSTSMKNTACKDAVDEWYSEVELYPFSNPPRFWHWSFAHFTQVVWKSTRRLGVGIAKNRRRVYIVARYTPPGNAGSFAQNVGNLRG